MNRNEREVVSHPSFAQIEFSRMQSSHSTGFYGSELPQQNYMVMRIHSSELHRDLSNDNYYNNKQLVEVKMTAIQYAELLTSMNYGSGIPCTLVKFGNERIEELPEIENRKSFVHRQFKNRMQQFADTLKEKSARAKELTAKKTLSKADQEELTHTVTWLTQEVASNIPYFAQCFQETTDRVVVEAKAEVENAILHKVTVLGLNALHEENKLLNK